MVTKKKTNTITYIGNPTSLDQQVTNQIPNLESSGVRFQGAYKLDKGGGKFEIKQQKENTIVIAFNSNLVGLPANTYTINRGNEGKIFIIEHIFVEYLLRTELRTQLQIKDSAGDNSLYFSFPNSQDGVTYSRDIIPKEYKGINISLVLSQAIPANEYITVHLSGWYEDIL